MYRNNTVMQDTQIEIKDVTKITYFFDDTVSNRFRPIIFDVNEGLLSKAYWQDKPSEILLRKWAMCDSRSLQAKIFGCKGEGNS
jgi:hypothetical protein